MSNMEYGCDHVLYYSDWPTFAIAHMMVHIPNKVSVFIPLYLTQKVGLGAIAMHQTIDNPI